MIYRVFLYFGVSILPLSSKIKRIITKNCHFVGVSTHDSRGALQLEKQGRKIGLKYNNVWCNIVLDPF